MSLVNNEWDGLWKSSLLCIVASHLLLSIGETVAVVS